jgi:hypothetical protein
MTFLMLSRSRQEAIQCKRPTYPSSPPGHDRLLTVDDRVDVSYLVSAARETVSFTAALDSAWESDIVSCSTI